MPTAVAAAALVVAGGAGLAVWRLDLLPGSKTASAPVQQIDLDLFPVRYGDKCGFVDPEGRPVINPQFDRVGFFDARSGLAPVALGDKWGLIDRRGQYVANPQFASLEPIRGLQDRFAARIGERVGIVDGVGTILVNPQFNGMASFVDPEGRILVQSGSKYGFINAAGAYVVAPQFDWISSDVDDAYFHRGLIPAKLDTRVGYIDATGQWRINPQFVSASSFDETTGLARVVIERTETVVDQAALSNWQADVAAIAARRRAELEAWGYSYVQVPTEQPDFSSTNTTYLSGFVNTEGRLVINPQYAGAGSFSAAGLAAVQVGEKWGYIDATGALKISPQFASASRFKTLGDQSLAVVSVQTGEGEQAQWRYGVIDATGAWLVQPQHDYLGAYGDNGLALARVGDQWGAIDRTGKYVINPGFSQLALLPDRAGYLFARAGATGTEVGILGLDGKPRVTVRGDLCVA